MVGQLCTPIHIMTPDLKKRKGKGSRKKMLEGPIQDTVATLDDIEDAMKFISNYIFVCELVYESVPVLRFKLIRRIRRIRAAGERLLAYKLRL